MHPIDRQLDARLREAFAAATGQSADPADPMVRAAADERFGDYQSNGAMALAKQLKTNPRKLAEQVVASAKLDDVCESAEVAGPGFINLRLKPDFVAAAAAEMAADPRLGVESAGRPETIVVDYSSPNIAKEMHVGHIRSTVLGDALARILDFLGHTVVRQNHVGDWGTQFGMLLAYMSERLAEADTHATSEPPDLGDLNEFYRQAKAQFDGDAAFAETARGCVVQLQSGEGGPFYAVWRQFRDVSLRHCQALYDRMGVGLRPEHARGESAYNDALPGVVKALDAKGLLTESEGAQCVFLDQFKGKDGQPLPVIVRKSDGGYLYATTDLAAMRYRVSELKAGRIVYVTDARQALHFEQIFAVARAAGFAPESVQLVHVAFGTIQGADGKPMKTREGDLIPLAAVLDEAEQRAGAVVEQKNPDLPADERAAVAHAVGIGAIKYFDLSNNRLSDYRFDWDQMLSLSGNTAPYLQYAHARIKSIFRKGGVSPDDPRAGPSPAPALDDPHELALAKHLARYGEAVARVVEDYRPNILCDYLYALAGRFTGFYENCPVLKADEPTRGHRLLLCRLTANVLRHGLGLLGIETPEQM